MVPLVLVGIGLLFVTTARVSGGTDLRAERKVELADLIEAEQGRLDGVTRRVQDLRTEVDRLSSRSNSQEQRRLQALTEQSAAAAGLSEVRGPAVEVTLNDAPVPEGGIPDGFGRKAHTILPRQERIVRIALEEFRPDIGLLAIRGGHDDLFVHPFDTPPPLHEVSRQPVE